MQVGFFNPAGSARARTATNGTNGANERNQQAGATQIDDPNADEVPATTRTSNRESGFQWAYVTVQMKNKDGTVYDADAGYVGGGKDRVTCLFCGEQYASQLIRINAHVGGLKGNHVSLCAGVKRKQDETIAQTEGRTDYIPYGHISPECQRFKPGLNRFLVAKV